MGVYNKLFDSVVENVFTECDIRPCDFQTGQVFHTDNALWDTGATNTIISSRVVHKLHLEPFQQAGISGIGGGVNAVNTYLVHISIPTGDTVTYLEAITYNLTSAHIKLHKHTQYAYYFPTIW